MTWAKEESKIFLSFSTFLALKKNIKKDIPPGAGLKIQIFCGVLTVNIFEALRQVNKQHF